MEGGDITDLLRACLVALRPPPHAEADPPRRSPFWSMGDAACRITRLLATLPEGAALDTLLPEIAEAGANRALHARAAMAATLVAALELSRHGTLTLEQEALGSPSRCSATMAHHPTPRPDRPKRVGSCRREGSLHSEKASKRRHPSCSTDENGPRCYAAAMRKAMPAATAVFTPGERDYIRRELDQFFSTLPRVADGVQLRTWRGGPQAGQPKVPAVAQGLLERGLVRLEPAPWPPRLYFTGAGLAALRAMMADGRLANPKTFAHVRRELGIDPDPVSDQGSAPGLLDAEQAAHGSGAAAFPSPPDWGNSPGPTEWKAPMARRPKTVTPPIPGRDRMAAEASPSADGPEPAGNEGDAPMAEMAVPVSSEPKSPAGPKEHEPAAAPSGDAVPPFLPPNTSAPAMPAARWDRASDRVSFDWPAIERTAAQHGPNQAMARLLLAARAEGARSRWPL